jgi:hypothetical protein
LRLRVAESEAVASELSRWEAEFADGQGLSAEQEEAAGNLTSALTKVSQDFLNDKQLRDQVLDAVRKGEARSPRLLVFLQGRICEIRLQTLAVLSRLLQASPRGVSEDIARQLAGLEATYREWFADARELHADLGDKRLHDTLETLTREALSKPRRAADWRQELFGEEPSSERQE